MSSQIITSPPNANNTYQKALALNLRPNIYGTIAEIGAGQEAARWFFHVGGAAGTVAKSMSAYDMTVSDQIYGKGTRFVSKDRLLAMLQHEYDLLIERLSSTRGADTNFFTFADTVSARNYSGTNECHGWMGVRFQATPGGPANDIILHVNMLDDTNALQQEALGILGVNLIYGAFFHRGNLTELLASFLEGLTAGRVEIDLAHFSGPEFVHFEQREIGVCLLRQKLARAVLFDKSGSLIAPTELFHNRPLLLLRGLFERPPSDVHCRMLHAGIPKIQAESGKEAKEPLAFFEMSVGNLKGDLANPGVLEKRISEVLATVDWLLLTEFRENYLLTNYLRRYSKHDPIRFVVGVSSLVFLFQSAFYGDLPGLLLEGIAKFLADNVKVYVQSMTWEQFVQHLGPGIGAPAGFEAPVSHMVTMDNIQFSSPLVHLYQYLRSIGALLPLDMEGSEGKLIQ